MLRGINVAVEIFVVKRLSVWNLVVILVAQRVGKVHKDIVYALDAERSPKLRLQELAQSSIVNRLKGIVALFTITASLTIATCSLFEPGEAVRHESGRTLYRAAEENPAGAPDVTPLREKVPGETR
jgi:hypothetical protein